MCLFIRDKEPQVAKRDIVVLKYLLEINGEYSSPCQGTPVTLGKLMVAQPDTPNINYDSTLALRMAIAAHGIVALAEAKYTVIGTTRAALTVLFLFMLLQKPKREKLE